jgi:4-hydroxy-tetrahydrodipicolinate synthase
VTSGIATSHAYLVTNTCRRLSAVPWVFAIKDATGGLDTASEVSALCDITQLSGDDALTVPFMSLGEAGGSAVSRAL